LSELIGHPQKKYGDAPAFGLLRSLTWFEDAESEPMPILLGSAASWDDIKTVIRDAVRLLALSR